MGDFENETSAQREMPRYQCHKQVWALKIKAIKQAPADQERAHKGGDWYLIPEDDGYGPVLVGHDEYILKHNPQVGGYYVVYEDGYKSFSPAAAFESGYSRLPFEGATQPAPADDNDFPLGQACDLSGEGTCEACQ